MADLLENTLIRRLAHSRVLRPALLLTTLAFFVLIIIAGFIGSPVGSSNVAIVFVWIFWFALLILIFLPFGRLWCMICPLPAPAEWISRGTIIKKSDRIINLGIRWPRQLDNIWLQNISFLTVAIFSPLILTRPDVSALVLLLFIILAIVFDITFKKGRPGKIFCRYVCPLGGFIGIYSYLGAVEVRVKDENICKSKCQFCGKSPEEVCMACGHKACINGSEKGDGCPWLIYPGGLRRNAYCGVCLECIKSCTYSNMTLKTRWFGDDLLVERRMDEAFKGFIMLGSAMVYSASYFGWWKGLKELINFSDSVFLSTELYWSRIATFAMLLVGLCVVVLPMLHLGFSWMSKAWGERDVSLKQTFIDYAYGTIPLGYMAWAAFSISMIMVNGSYIISTLSDPFGWGWNIFNTAGYKWAPYQTGLLPYIQMIMLLGGCLLAVNVIWNVSLEDFKENAIKAAIPMTLFYALLTSFLMFLFVMP